MQIFVISSHPLNGAGHTGPGLRPDFWQVEKHDVKASAMPSLKCSLCAEVLSAVQLCPGGMTRKKGINSIKEVLKGMEAPGAYTKVREERAPDTMYRTQRGTRAFLEWAAGGAEHVDALHFCANLNESPAVAPVHSEPKIAKMGSGPRARMASAV